MPSVPCGDRGNCMGLRIIASSKPRMFCEERLNLELSRNMSVHEFYRLKALITLEQVNTTE